MMGYRYRKLQIVKHALQHYVQRPNATEKDVTQEINLLNEIENEIEAYKEKYCINYRKVEKSSQ